MTPKTKLAPSVKLENKPPKEYPEIVAMPAEELVEKIRSALDKFYREGLYSVHLAHMARAMVLLSDYINEHGPLLDATTNLYNAAVWHADRPVDAEGLWAAVRDAADLEPGMSPEPMPGKMIFVPAAHVPAIEATLAYLVKV